MLSHEQPMPTHPIQVHFSPNGRILATGFYNATVWLWDGTTGESVLGPLRHKDFIEDTAFSPDGTSLLVASHDGTAYLWDLARGRALTEPVKAAASLRAVQFL